MAASKANLENPGVVERYLGIKKSKKGTIQVKDGEVIMNGYFRMQEGTYRILERNIVKAKKNTLLLGPTGLGKTEMVDNIAMVLGMDITILDMGTMTDPIMGLVGTHVVKVKGGVTSSVFVPSRFSEVIQKPGIVLLDEISRASAQANNLLFPVLDFRRELPMEYSFDNREPVKVHPDCVFIATANTGSQYTGTHKLDKALTNRFMPIEVDELTTSGIQGLVTSHRPSLKSAEVSKIVSTYMKINKAHAEYNSSFGLSPRNIKDIAELVADGFTIYDSYYTICKGIGSKEGLTALESILSETKKA